MKIAPVALLAALFAATAEAKHVSNRSVYDYYLCRHTLECLSPFSKCCSSSRNNADLYMRCGPWRVSSMYTGRVNGYDYQCNGEEASLIFWSDRTNAECRTDFIYKLLFVAIGTIVQMVYGFSPFANWLNTASNFMSLQLWFFDFMGYYNGYQPTGDVGVMMGGINRGFLHLAQSDLDCALAGADEKLGDGFGAKMHFYLTSMIEAQDDYQATNAFSPLSVLGPFDIIGWLTPRRIGGLAYDFITLILYFNAISEPGAEAEVTTPAVTPS